ncbi:MAG: HAD family hydrolase [Dokdonella sp.]|uniref:HAD family hydrolase n=1 Tax=Dokdonella sp. TaxID=2291710 RepID=UPI003264550C
MLRVAERLFLFDVDNTLLDNDRFAEDLRARLTRDFGVAGCERYWAIYERLRKERGVADYIDALQEFGITLEGEPTLLGLSSFLLDYPFAERVYPGALATLAEMRERGHVAILSDGDLVFQPRKIQRSGLWDAVDGAVMIDRHKELSLDAMQKRHPALHYVMVDDKPHILAAMKRVLGARLTTVFVRQGHYAAQSDLAAIDPAPDRIIAKISDLTHLDWNDSVAASSPSTTETA